MQIKLRAVGHSAGVVLPKDLLNQLNVEIGQLLAVTVEDGALVMRRSTNDQEGAWAEAAKKLASTSEIKPWEDASERTNLGGYSW